MSSSVSRKQKNKKSIKKRVRISKKDYLQVAFDGKVTEARKGGIIYLDK